MSDAPVHQTPVVEPAVVEPTKATETSTDAVPSTAVDTPAVDSAKTDNEITPVGGVTAQPSTTEGAAETEAAPVTEGVLGYKGPGLIKGFYFSKKFFWFGDEAVDSKSLATYLKNEKAEIAHPTAAHATQTGKGLLFYAKRVEDKASPAGVLNLGIASDVVTEDLTDFSFKVHGHKHTFQAATKAERDAWLKAVETTVTEAKAAHENIVGSEGYKSELAKFTPVAAAPVAAAAARSHSKPKESKVHDGALENDVAATGAATETTPKVAETKTDTKSRSQSRKRQSIFGKVLGKKEELEEKREIKKEEKAEKKEEKAEEKAEAKPEAAVAGASALDAPAVAARVMDAPVATEGAVAGETSAPVTAATETPVAPKPTKRGSVFGSIFGKKDGVSPTTERKEKDVVPAVPAKDTEVAPAAPQLEPVSTSVPSEEVAPVAAEPAVPATAAPVTTTEGAATSTPAVKDKRRQSFFGSLGGKKEKSPSSESSGKGLTGLFRKASSAAKGDKGPAPPSKDVPPVPSTTEANPAAAEEPMTNGVEHEKANEPIVPETTSTTQPAHIQASA